MIEILIELFGTILSKYLLPYLEGETKTYLEQIMPTVQHWVDSLETTTLKGDEKRKSAFDNIVRVLMEQGLPVIESKINTALEMAVDSIQTKQ